MRGENVLVKCYAHVREEEEEEGEGEGRGVEREVISRHREILGKFCKFTIYKFSIYPLIDNMYYLQLCVSNLI